MTKVALENVMIGFSANYPFASFKIGKYTFKYSGPDMPAGLSINFLDEARKCHQNAVVEYEGDDEPTVLFVKDGVIGRRGQDELKSKERNFLEDIMVLGSIMNGWNWQIVDHKNYSDYWPIGKNNLVDIFDFSPTICSTLMNRAVLKINDPSWQKQFENGYQLIMLRNRSKIHIQEPRFITNFSLWEWLYPHLQNPGGATIEDEGETRDIVPGVLEKYFGERLNKKIFDGEEHDIFTVLRNQLAHTSRIPINRPYAADWIKELGEKEINLYLEFFDLLTQLIVLRTLDIDTENQLFESKSDMLKLFLATGKISSSKLKKP